MVCSAETKWVSVSLLPPVFTLRSNSGNADDETSTLKRWPAAMVTPVCQRSIVYL
jgi:hypothetical protein